MVVKWPGKSERDFAVGHSTACEPVHARDDRQVSALQTYHSSALDCKPQTAPAGAGACSNSVSAGVKLANQQHYQHRCETVVD